MGKGGDGADIDVNAEVSTKPNAKPNADIIVKSLVTACSFH